MQGRLGLQMLARREGKDLGTFGWNGWMGCEWHNFEFLIPLSDIYLL